MRRSRTAAVHPALERPLDKQYKRWWMLRPTPPSSARNLFRSAAHVVARCRALPTHPTIFRVLAFMPIGRDHADIVTSKCQRLVDTANLSLYLAHYDNSQELFRKMSWYRRVAYTATVPRDVKIVLAKKLLLQDAHMRTQLLSHFSHVWVTDEDVVFPEAPSLQRFLDVAAALDAAVTYLWSNLFTVDACTLDASRLLTELMHR